MIAYFLNLLGFCGIILGGIKIYNILTAGWCRSQKCLIGKTVVVTGANSGIGFETALDFAKRGARVILACRNEARAEEARSRIIFETGNENVVYRLVDMESFESVRKFAKQIINNEDRIDILVNNAGIAGFTEKLTVDGNQLGMQVNYLAPFLLTNLLLDLLIKTGNSRIVNVASLIGKYAKLNINDLKEFPKSIKVYARSKLCNILFTVELANKLKGTTVTTYSVHPGVIYTDLLFSLFPLSITKLIAPLGKVFCKNILEGAQTQIHVSLQKDIETFNGEHFHDCKRVTPYKTVDIEKAKKLWEISEKIVNKNQ